MEGIPTLFTAEMFREEDTTGTAGKTVAPAASGAGGIMERMDIIIESFYAALRLIASGDAQLREILLLSFQVNLTAVAVAAAIAMPFGALLVFVRFPGRRLLIILLNAAMGFPPVVAGLIVYLALSRSGPLGALGWLYTPTAMILVQVLLIFPIIAALTRRDITELWENYREQMLSFGVKPAGAVMTMLWEARFSLATNVLAGFGRASAEVGGVMIVGGNINHHTRVMTTAIALETSKGILDLALALGMILLTVSLGVNALVVLVEERRRRFWVSAP